MMASVKFQNHDLLPYAVYDVFTDAPFGGNPLAVVFGADGLNDSQMQLIAREFNFSETVFLLGATDASNTAKLRIFTPTQELPFAGHPIIGAVIALSDQGAGPVLNLELEVGRVPAQVENGTASFLASQPVKILAHPEIDLIAKTLGLQPADIASPPIMASMGVPFTFCELTSRAAVSNIEIDLQSMKDGNAHHPSSRDFSQAAYWRDELASKECGHDVVHLRMFAPLDSIPEDPATGSAAATLANLFYKQSKMSVSLTVYQGYDMGRPSKIIAHAGPEGVTISGGAVQIMQGQMRRD